MTCRARMGDWVKPRHWQLSIATSVAALLMAGCSLEAWGQPSPPDTPTFRSTSTLVFLDVTVLDKKGHPVVKGLTKDDFTITEDKKPQKIFSFEAPDVHVMTPGESVENPDGKAPVTVFVLDMLNSEFQDFAFIRYSVSQFLKAQPEQLAAPAEMMVVGNESLEMLQGFTRSRADLLYALDHLPAALPYKRTNASFFWERFAQSIDALQQIALQNKGIPGRKNIVWVGHGAPGINLTGAVLTDPQINELRSYVHATANMLVDSRISLFVIYPGLSVNRPSFSLSATEADADIGETDPFAGDINFGVLVDETGGRLFFNRNDVDMLIKRSIRLGSEYYTLTYQPHDVPFDGKFRRIRVSLRNPNLQALTKAGYFAPEKNQPADPRQNSLASLVEAARSTIPYNALNLHIASVVRHPDTRTADITVQLSDKNLNWQPTQDGKSETSLLVDVASRDKYQSVLASRMERLKITTASAESVNQARDVTRWAVTVRLPRKTREIRVVMETEAGGRIGSAVADQATIVAAPALPTPEPKLAPALPQNVPPTSPPS
jgi:VWFA-related protein